MMPLRPYTFGDPHIDKATSEHVRFPMTDGQQVIAGRIGIAVIRARFGGSDPDPDPMTLFLHHRRPIEDATSAKFDRTGAPDNLIEVYAEDFEEP
ncbi:DUF1488 family protein [Methylobacterium planeticum]|uniref:DUF1488 family protein n=1 Tax=Methylobacterium planeticum TaxID=2615211 RepID=A0A6N6MW52_9HYPH|nr:DUF1488 family protein [Methylobacterium planeticum]KAB1073200.1 DUF1488 family protein [Methylobacterium planeticum]